MMLRLLVGLGNPGPKYVATRHNFGFLLLDRVAERLQSDPLWTLTQERETPGLGRWVTYSSSGCSAHLLWPWTYMNRSGAAVERLLSVLPDEFDHRRDMLVAIDDLSLDLGRVRIRAKGSTGGHNGLKSVEAHLAHRDYARLKLGIGHPPPECSAVDYVLGTFDKQENEILESVLEFVAVQTSEWLKGASIPELSQVINGWRAPEAEGVVE